MVRELVVETPGQGLHEITARVASLVRDAKLEEGLCTLFVRHTSASLIIQENADPAVLRDLVRWMDRLAPEGGHYEHDAEGPDDMPAHIKAALTQTSVAIPIRGGERELLLHVAG